MGGDRGMSETTERENAWMEDKSGEDPTAGSLGAEDGFEPGEISRASKGGNIFTRIVEEKNRKKEAKRREAEKVLNVLSSLSEVEGVSISPDHKPGEALVKGPGAEEGEEIPETAQVADGKRTGFWGQKAQAGVSSHASREKQGGRGEGRSAENTAEQGGEALDDGRKPLHNPLPVPKKKAATMLDYDYEVSDDDDYDYD